MSKEIPQEGSSCGGMGDANVVLGDENEVLAATQRWFNTCVLGLNLCPFAHAPAKAGNIHFSMLYEPSEAALLRVLEQELQRLHDIPSAELETTVIVAPNGYEDFYYYMDVVAYLEQWLAKNGWEGEFQIASFHPHYQFAGTQPSDAENLTNCSPYPLFHLLREASLTEATDRGADANAITERNIARMQKLTAQERETLFPYRFK